MTSAERRLTALHESAHAVIATLTGMDVKRCVLHAPGSRRDEDGHTALYDWAEERDCDIERHLTFVLAGRAAEYKAVGRYSERGDGDWEQATAYAACVLNAAPESPRVAEFLRIAQLHAETYMHDAAIWGWIERVSRQLLKRRTLGCRDIQLLREAR